MRSELYTQAVSLIVRLIRGETSLNGTNQNIRRAECRMPNKVRIHRGPIMHQQFRRQTDTYPDCTNGFGLQMKGENVTRIKARGF